MSIDVTIKLFADLTAGSSRAEVDAAVEQVVSALVATIGDTPDIPAARRNVANLLDYLHSLKTSRHPGRVRLATELGEKIIPLLYEQEMPEPKKDTYPFLEEEKAVINRATEIMGEVLCFLCAEDRAHPRFQAPIRDDGITPMFLFAPQFQDGFQKLLSVLVRNFMRSKHSETALYQPIRDILVGHDQSPISRYDKQIDNLVCTAFERAQKNHHPAEPSGPDSTEKAANRSPLSGDADKDAARDAIEVAHLHAQETGYFLPYDLDFESLSVIYTLDKESMVKGLVALGHAASQGESENYVLRQIDRLNSSHDLIHFDITVLSAFLYGEEDERLGFKELHDTCIGAASSRKGMIRMRPILAAELSRRPHHLARQLLKFVDDTGRKREEYEGWLETFTRWIAILNGRRFEEEIFGCVSQIWGNDVLKPLVEWIQNDDRDPDTAPAAINEVSIRRDDAFQQA